MGPLAGIRIIEMAGIGPAPFAAMMLSDLGAEVIRIDRKGRPETNAFDVIKSGGFLNRGRRSIALDLKKAQAVSALFDLIASADALLEGFRPGVMERLGLGPQACLARNPGLVYGRITGWGQNGPLAHTAGHDINYIALTGALHAIGKAEAPVPPLNMVGDFGGGAMFVAFGMVCALLEARTSGQGQVVDAAMTDGAALDRLAAGGVVPGYIGFDPTAPSLHVGSLVQIMLLRRMQQTGHKPIVLMGGGTGKIGDPSFKDEARKLLGEDGIFYAEILAWLGADLVLVPSYFYMMRKLHRTRE